MVTINHKIVKFNKDEIIIFYKTFNKYPLQRIKKYKCK